VTDRVSAAPAQSASKQALLPRTKLVENLRESLCAKGRLVLTDEGGPGTGLGKTELARQYSARNAASYDRVMWVRGHSRAVFNSQCAATASRLGVCPDAGDDQSKMIDGMFDWLAASDRWLLVVDGVPDWRLLEDRLDSLSTGHVIVTSGKASGWPENFDGFAVPPFEAAEFDRLAECLGGKAGGTNGARALPAAMMVPLVADMALRYCRATGHVPCRAHVAEAWGNGKYPPGRSVNRAENEVLDSLVADVLGRLEERYPAAYQLAVVCAHLDGQSIPMGLLRDGRAYLPEPLRQGLGNEGDTAVMADRLCELSLLRGGPKEVSMPQALQRAVRQCLSPTAGRDWTERAVRIVTAGFPHEEVYHGYLPACGQLMGAVLTTTHGCIRADAALEEAGVLLNRAGQYLYACADFRSANECFEYASRIAARVAGPCAEPTVVRLNNLGAGQLAAGEHESACETFKQVLSLLKKQGLPDARLMSEVVRNLANTYVAHENWDQARVWLKEGLAIHLEVHDWDHPYVAECLNHLGVVFWRMDQLPQARKSFEHAVQSGKGGACRPEELAQYLTNLGNLLRSEGEPAESEGHFREALALDKSCFGEDHENTIAVRISLGRVLRRQRKYREAVEQFKQAHTVVAAKKPSRPETEMRTVRELARTYMLLDEHGPAQAWYERAIALCDGHHGFTEHDAVDILMDLGRLWMDVEDWARATDAFDRAMAICRRSSETAPERIGDIFSLLGRVEEGRECLEPAVDYFNRAVAATSQALGQDHPNVARDAVNLGRCLDRLDRTLEAVAQVVRAERIYAEALGPEHSKTRSVRKLLADLRE